jgi:hypothetical protein
MTWRSTRCLTIVFQGDECPAWVPPILIRYLGE